MAEPKKNKKVAKVKTPKVQTETSTDTVSEPKKTSTARLNIKW